MPTSELDYKWNGPDPVQSGISKEVIRRMETDLGKVTTRTATYSFLTLNLFVSKPSMA